MSRFRFSSGLFGSDAPEVFFGRREYETLLRLAKDLSFGQDWSEVKLLNPYIDLYEPALVLTPDNAAAFCVSVVASVADRHSLLSGSDFYQSFDKSETEWMQLRKRPFGCFTVREIVAMTRLCDEYHNGATFINVCAANGVYLTDHPNWDGYLWPTTNEDNDSQYVVAIDINDNLVTKSNTKAMKTFSKVWQTYPGLLSQEKMLRLI